MVPWNAKKSNEGSLEALRNLANDQERTLNYFTPKLPKHHFETRRD